MYIDSQRMWRRSKRVTGTHGIESSRVGQTRASSDQACVSGHYLGVAGCWQCVAVCCSVLQCVAVCCNVVQCFAVCCSLLHRVAVCCSVLQCVAECCNVLQCVAKGMSTRPRLQQCAAVCCRVLQRFADSRSVLQCVAVCCTGMDTRPRLQAHLQARLLL